MSFQTETHPRELWPEAAATAVKASLPRSGTVVLTGGSAAELVFPRLIAPEVHWQSISVYFSDERAVPQDDPHSNFGLIDETLLKHVEPRSIHRIRGEEEPPQAAHAYEQVVALAVEKGFDLVLLGMGADAHVAGLFPGSPALESADKLCLPVHRPDGLVGITLTPKALIGAHRILLLVSGSSKADAVRRAVTGDETPASCPVRFLAEHPDVRFVLDESAAALL